MKKNHYDLYPDPKKENWSGVVGLFILPLFLLLSGYALYRGGVMTKDNFVRTNFRPQAGIGGAPPESSNINTDRNSNFLVYNSSLRNGSANGYLAETVYKKGGRVYLNSLATYKQNCMTEQPTTETHKIVISKGIDSYSKQNGYNWNIRFSLTPPANLCPDGSIPSPITQSSISGKVYVSADGGKTTMNNPSSNLPMEVNLSL